MNRQSSSHEFEHLERAIRQAADSLEVSQDLRHRVLDQAYWFVRQEYAWSKLATICLLISCVANLLLQVTETGEAVGGLPEKAVVWRRLDEVAFPFSVRETPPGRLTWRGFLEDVQ